MRRTAAALAAAAVLFGAAHAAPVVRGAIERPGAEAAAPVAPAPPAPRIRAPGAPAYLAVVVDDLGNRPAADRRAAALPAAVGCAVLPGAPHAREAAAGARRGGHELLLHLPMQAPGSDAADPYLLTAALGADAVAARLRAALDRVPGAAGVNNHQGSTLTARHDSMAVLMRALTESGLYFLDSRTTAATVAAQAAAGAGVPYLARNVFLDHDPAAGAVRAQWERALSLARTQGQALAIGHPRVATLALLETELPGLKAAGITLVPPSALLTRRALPGATPLQAKDPAPEARARPSH